MNNTVKTNLSQSLTDAQKQQARTNIGAGTVSSVSIKLNGETKGTVTASGTIDLGSTSEGSVTSVSVKMNGSVMGTVTESGTIDLGTVLTSTTFTNNVTVQSGTNNVVFGLDSSGKAQIICTNSGDPSGVIYYELNGYKFNGKSTSSFEADSLQDTGDSTKYVYCGYAGNSIASVTPSHTTDPTISESQYLISVYYSNGDAYYKDVNAGNVTVGNSLKWNGYSVVVGSTGTDTDTFYIV